MGISRIDPNTHVVDRDGRPTRQGFQLLSSIHELPSYSVDQLPSPAKPGRMIYVTDETGGAQPAFADGTNWRRFTDRAIVS
jgi:hypothetical protein